MSGKKNKHKDSAKKQPVTEVPKVDTKLKKPRENFSPKASDPFRWMKWMIFLLPFVIYVNTLGNKYSMDDDLVTSETNQLTTQGITAIPQIFTSLYSENDTQAYEYRPFVLASFAIEHQLLGVNPMISHFIQILLYAWLCLLVFKTSKRVFPKLGMWFHFLVGLVFVFHPLHTEVVASIKNRDELLAFIFSLLALNSVLSHAFTGKWKYLVYAVLFFMVAWFSKRSCWPYLVLIPFSVYIANILPTDEKGRISWQGAKKLIFYGLFLGIICMGVQKIISNFYLGGDLFHRETHMFENPMYLSDPGLIGKVGMAGYTYGYYFKLLLYPHPLVCYYGFNYVNYVGWGSWLSVVGFIVAFGSGIYALYKIRTRQPWVYGVLLLLISLSMFANFVRPAVGIIAERFAFEASLGFCFLVAWALLRLNKIELTIQKWPKGKPLFGGVLFLMLVLYSYKTISRNADWYDQKSIYKADAASAPQSTKLQSLLASSYTTALQENILGKRVLTQAQQYEHMDSAIRCFRNAIKIFPNYVAVNNNLGMVYFTYKNMVDSAEYYIDKAIQLKGDYLQAHYNMATIYEQRFLRKDELIKFLDFMYPGDTATFNFKTGVVETRAVKELDSILDPLMVVSMQFKVNALNSIRNYVRSSQGAFDPKLLIETIQRYVQYVHGELDMGVPTNTVLAENITREVKKRLQGGKSTIDGPLDSLASVYFFPVIANKLKAAIASKGPLPAGTITRLKSFAKIYELKHRQKAYYHWKETLKIECTYHNSYEKLKEWNTKKNEYDSTISINTMLLSCHNNKKADAYWQIANAWMLKGDSLKGVEMFEKMLIESDKLINRYQTAIVHMTQAGNNHTRQAITNNFYGSATSIYQVLKEMQLYYSKQNRNEDVKRMDEKMNKLSALFPARQ
ncbi:MAG: hypothetical protein ACHQF2_00410 [Flavobacteriales bacterium]